MSAELVAPDAAVLDTRYERLTPRELETFGRLYDYGEVTERSPSEADWKLLCLIGKLTRDAETAERLARSSALATAADMWSGGKHVSTDTSRPRKWDRLVRSQVVKALRATERDYARATHYAAEREPRNDYAEDACIRARTLSDIWRDPDALAPPVALIPRLAWRGRVTVYSSPDKGGKSTLSTAGVAALTTGQAFLDGLPQPPAAVLWLKLEEHVNDFAIRAKAFGADGERLAVFELKPGLTDVRREAVERSVAVIVFDVLIRWAGDRVTEGGQAAQWAPIMDELRQLARELNVAVLVLHHARRTDGKVRDSGEITANADVVIEQEALPKEGVQRFTVRGRFPVSDFAVQLVNGTRYELTDGATALAAAEDALDAKVWAWIKANPGASKRTVRQGVGGTAERVDEALARLIDGRGRRIENRGTSSHAKLYVGESLPEV